MSTNYTGANAPVKRSVAAASKGKKTAKETSVEVLAANDTRAEFTISNPSGKTVWVALGATAVKEEGLWLPANSTYINNSYTGAVSVITSSGEGEVSFTEV